MTLTQDRRTELLAACRLFSGVAPPDLVGRRAIEPIEVDFPANHVIARQGEIGTGFFLVVSGVGPRHSRRRGGRRSSGPASSSASCRSSTGCRAIAQVVAREPTRCLALASWDFEQALLDSPTLALSILRGPRRAPSFA